MIDLRQKIHLSRALVNSRLEGAPPETFAEIEGIALDQNLAGLETMEALLRVLDNMRRRVRALIARGAATEADFEGLFGR